MKSTSQIHLHKKQNKEIFWCIQLGKQNPTGVRLSRGKQKFALLLDPGGSLGKLFSPAWLHSQAIALISVT